MDLDVYYNEAKMRWLRYMLNLWAKQRRLAIGLDGLAFIYLDARAESPGFVIRFWLSDADLSFSRPVALVNFTLFRCDQNDLLQNRSWDADTSIRGKIQEYVGERTTRRTNRLNEDDIALFPSARPGF